MKHLLLLFLITLTGVVSTQAQKIGNAEIKKADHFVWFGLDFSALQCVGRAGFPDADDVVDSKVHSWNELMITEHDKFNVNKFFDKKEFHYDLASSDRQNEKLSSEGLIVGKAEEFDRAKIESILSNYASDEYPSGLGLLFIVEKFDKNENKAAIHVTFFDIVTKDIVQTVKYNGDPGGFGLRNYWARSVLDVMESLEDDYKKWLKKNK